MTGSTCERLAFLASQSWHIFERSDKHEAVIAFWMWRNCLIRWDTFRSWIKILKLLAVVVVYIYLRAIYAPVHIALPYTTHWLPMFSSNIYQLCAWYILLRTVYAEFILLPGTRSNIWGQDAVLRCGATASCSSSPWADWSDLIGSVITCSAMSL